MILEIIEPYFEVANLILAIAIVVIGFIVNSKLKGDLKRAWGYLLVAISLFGIHEIVGSLEEFGIWSIDGAYILTEFLYIAAFFLAVVMFKKLFGNITKR
jgi:hypothetical protein